MRWWPWQIDGPDQVLARPPTSLGELGPDSSVGHGQVEMGSDMGEYHVGNDDGGTAL